jgi:hypothetical protein
MIIPYVLATGCVVIAASAQFHTQVTSDFREVENDIVPPDDLADNYYGLLTNRMYAQDPYTKRMIESTPIAVRDQFLKNELDSFLAETELEEKRVAAALVNRRSKHLAGALKPLTGQLVADVIFGLGVLAMALSTISLLMLISGFVICEMFGAPPSGWTHRMGTLVAGVIGAFGPYIWTNKAQFYLAVPTSVFGLALLPFAYITFLLLMNQKSLLGNDLPQGSKRLVWNALMLTSAGIATAASLYVVFTKTQKAFGSGWYGLGGVGLLLVAILIAQFTRPPATE